MLTQDIINQVNELLAGETKTYEDYEYLFDKVIDDINSQMNTRYPAFSELRNAYQGINPMQYDMFPDRYIRLVLIPGTAYYFYTVDEEGIDTAPAYKEDYYRGLFMMLRDYIEYDPRYQANDDVGSIPMHPDVGYAGGVEVHGDIWKI